MDFSEKVATNYLKLVNLSQYTSLVKGKKPNFFKLMLYDYLLIYLPVLSKPKKNVYNFILEEKAEMIVRKEDFLIEEIIKKYEQVEPQVEFFQLSYDELNNSNMDYRHVLADKKKRIYKEIVELEYRRKVKINNFFLRRTGKSYLDNYVDLTKEEKNILIDYLKIFLKRTEKKYLQYLEKKVMQRTNLIKSDIIHEIYRNKVGRKGIESIISKMPNIFQIGYKIDKTMILQCNKIIRPFCLRINPPDELYMVVDRGSGVPDILNCLHEFGHLFYTLLKKDSGFSWYSPDKLKDEYVAILFECFAMNTYFLGKVLGVDNVHNITSICEEMEIISLRKYCGLLLYELQIYNKNGKLKEIDECKKIYINIFKDIYKCEIDENECMHVIEQGVASYFYFFANLNALAFLKMKRKAKGEQWYTKAGAFEDIVKSIDTVNTDFNIISNYI